ncbi:MAG: Lrp/AsnC family transcriptional regulator [Candidatus Micrarchaeota archaeon]
MTELSDKDWRIIECLKENSRQSTADISRKTKIPRATVHERIEKMKKEGIIDKFTVKLDCDKIGMHATSIILVAYGGDVPGRERKMAEEFAKHPEVRDVHVVAGEWDFVLKVKGRTPQEIGKFILEKIRLVEGVGKTVTMPAWESLKEEV